MTVKIPGWAWGLLAGLVAAAGVVVFYLVAAGRRRPGPAPDPYQDVPALYLETARQELEAARQVDAEAQAVQDEVAEILATPNPDTRTADLAELLNRWNP